MRLRDAVNSYFADMRADGRINSDRTELRYWNVLDLHIKDVGNRDPRTIGRDDIKRTLDRWPNPNTRRISRSILVSFYRWTVEEGIRPHNPAEQTRRPKKKPSDKYRLTWEEAGELLHAGQTQRERWALHLGLCAGLRSEEMRGLRGHHLARDGWIHLDAAIAKGGRPRTIPVIPQLEPVIGEIRLEVADQEHVICAMRWSNPGTNTTKRNYRERPLSAKGLWELVRDAGRRIDLAGPISPHTLRHAFCDHVARGVGERIAQAMLGHATIATTEIYLGAVTLDELQAATNQLGGYPPPDTPETPVKATTGIEPVLPGHHHPTPTSRKQRRPT